MTDYIFPQKLADFMGKITMRTQMEATMLSLTFIMFGMIFFAVYIIFFLEATKFFKIGVAVNSFFGLMFLSSYLVTTYQQYKTYKMAMNLYKEKEEKN
jgi:O-antigen/teichoic acid export membrane protein